MSQTVDQPPVETTARSDLAAAIVAVLAASHEPLTLSKLRAALPSPYRSMNLDELADTLHKQVAANVLYQYPKYRSQQDRFWDRAMPVHVAALLRDLLAEEPLAVSELRRKIPAYAVAQLETVLMEQVSQGMLHRHPRAGKRGGERFGVRRPDPKDYLRKELETVFRDLEQMGFSAARIREGALDLLHEEEWATSKESPAGEQSSSSQRAPTSMQSEESSQAVLEQAETHPEGPDALQQ
jgi:hypothetical protein